MYGFDYNAPAELYPGRNRKSAKKVSYRRFETAADAIRFAIEELPELLLLGACIEINEQQLSYKDIQALYASEQYPLKKPVNSRARASPSRGRSSVVPSGNPCHRTRSAAQNYQRFCVSWTGHLRWNPKQESLRVNTKSQFLG